LDMERAMKTISKVVAKAQGGSLWTVGDDEIFADRRQDGSVYVRNADHQAEAAGRAERNGVDPGDIESWDVDASELEAAIRDYLGLADEVTVEIR